MPPTQHPQPAEEPLASRSPIVIDESVAPVEMQQRSFADRTAGLQDRGLADFCRQGARIVRAVRQKDFVLRVLRLQGEVDDVRPDFGREAEEGEGAG